MAEPAARLSDPIAHTDAFGMLLVGVVAGAAVAGALVAVGITGGLATPFVVAGVAAAAAGGGLAGMSIGEAMTTVTGAIASGSADTFIEGRSAARAAQDTGACTSQLGVPHGSPLVAQGSENVFINGVMAARKGDKLVCGARIAKGATETFIGGGAVTAPGLQIDEEVPAWMRWSLLGVAVVGTGAVTWGMIPIAGAAVTFSSLGGGVVGSMGLGFVGGKVGEHYGGEWFGRPELGARIGEAFGGLLGGLVGGFLGTGLGGKFSSPLNQIDPAKDAKRVGYELEHLENLLKHSAGKLNIMRESNPASLQHHPNAQGVKQKTPDGGEYLPKPPWLHEHTAKPGKPNEGIVVNKDGTPFKDDQGNYYYADYDNQGLYKLKPDGSYEPIHLNDPAELAQFNKAISQHENYGQHGGNDEHLWPNGTPKRQPGGTEKYLVLKDGELYEVSGTGQLQRFYEEKGLPWPYNDYNPPPKFIVFPESES